MTIIFDDFFNDFHYVMTPIPLFPRGGHVFVHNFCIYFWKGWRGTWTINIGVRPNTFVYPSWTIYIPHTFRRFSFVDDHHWQLTFPMLIFIPHMWRFPLLIIIVDFHLWWVPLLMIFLVVYTFILVDFHWWFSLLTFILMSFVLITQ